MKLPISKEFIDDAVDQVEKWTNIFTIIAARMIPLLGILCQVVPSFFLFFVTDLGNEAFHLPFPMWWA